MFDSHYSIVESSLFIAQRDIINPDVRRRVWFKLDGDQVELLAIEKIDGVSSS